MNYALFLFEATLLALILLLAVCCNISPYRNSNLIRNEKEFE